MKPQVAFVFALILSLLAGCSGGAPATPPAAPTELPPPTATVPAEPTVRPTRTPWPSPTPRPCISEGDQTYINARLRAANDVAVLCPGAVIELTGPVVFTADGQQVYTEGLPTDDTRAVLRIVSPDLSNAVYMRDFNNAILSHVVVDGNRPALGYKGGDALIYAGGSSTGQVIRHVRIIEPRSWSALQLIQGHPAPEPPCTNALVENNEIGPAGQSDGSWSDGISLGCTNTIVRNNLIVDATDGGIVIFGAPGSIIEGNTIRAEKRILLGGINMVDYNEPYNGDYTGTIVRNNIIDAQGAVIRIGLGMGFRVWGCWPPADDRVLFGGQVIGNVLRGENMQYGYAVSGVKDWTVLDNRDESTHVGRATRDCYGKIPANPAGFQLDPKRSQGTFQPEFTEGYLDLALMAVRSQPFP